MVRKIILFFLLFAIVHWSPCFAHEGEDTQLGVTEKLGQLAAVDTVFTDEDGNQVALKDVLNKPTLLLPVYFACPDVCDLLQGNLTGILPKVEMRPGDEYQVLSVSFDPNDTPKIAKRRKTDFLSAMGNAFPQKGWLFLTGAEKSIENLMDSLGFEFQKKDGMYLHPVVVVALAPGGKIARYLYGDDFLPFDVTMAMTEANQGKTGLSIKRVLAYCFSYDPKGKKYVLNATRIGGTAILSLLFFFAMALVFAGKKKRSKKDSGQ